MQEIGNTNTVNGNTNTVNGNTNTVQWFPWKPGYKLTGVPQKLIALCSHAEICLYGNFFVNTLSIETLPFRVGNQCNIKGAIIKYLTQFLKVVLYVAMVGQLQVSKQTNRTISS